MSSILIKLFFDLHKLQTLFFEHSWHWQTLRQTEQGLLGSSILFFLQFPFLRKVRLTTIRRELAK